MVKGLSSTGLPRLVKIVAVVDYDSDIDCDNYYSGVIMMIIMVAVVMILMMVAVVVMMMMVAVEMVVGMIMMVATML